MGLKINTALKPGWAELVERTMNSEGGPELFQLDSEILRLLCCWLKLELDRIFGFVVS